MLVVFLSGFFFFLFFTLSGKLHQEMMLLLSFLMEPFTLEPVSSSELVLRSHLVIPLWVTVLGTQLMGTNNTGGVGGRVSQGKTRENQKPSRD